jgi:hypothetical protein
VADSNFDIWRLQAQADIRGLIEAVRDGDPEIGIRAVTALRSLGATNSIPALQTLLVSVKDPALRTVLISTLDFLFQQEMEDDEDDDEDKPSAKQQENRTVHLIAQLNSNSPEQAIRAAQTLADMKEKLAAEALVVVFHNRQLAAEVRLAAAEALIKLESAPVEVTLLAALRNPDWRIRRNATAVLGQLHADWAVHPLIAALRDEQEIVRRTAYAALKRIGTTAALQAIEPPTLVAPVLPQIKPLAPEPIKPKVDPSAVTKPLSPPKPIEPVAVETQPPAEMPPPIVPEATANPVLATKHSEAESVQKMMVDDVTRPNRSALAAVIIPIENPLPFDDDEETQPSTPPNLPDDVS